MIICCALMIYGHPFTVMAQSNEMAADQSVMEHCNMAMTEHAQMQAAPQQSEPASQKSCCDTGDCDYSCMGMSVTLSAQAALPSTIAPHSPLKGSISPMIGICLSDDSPPPQA